MVQNVSTGTFLANQARGRDVALPFALCFTSFCVFAALLISWKPIQLSIATVFFFAGPHNWMEFRYFLARMPARWGKSRLFYSIGLGGMVFLTLAYAVIFALGQSWYLNPVAQTICFSIWDTAMLLWLCTLIFLRGRQRKGRDWSWVFAAGLAMSAFAWLAPLWFSLGLVYLHPLVALWFLDRQLKRTRPHWRRAYHFCLALLPFILVVMWTQTAHQANLDNSDALSWRITQHAGAGILTGISSYFLVASHVFLETVHYGVWLVLIPLAGISGSVWSTKGIPLAVHRDGWPTAVKLALAFGVFAVLVLWVSFGVNFTTTRDIYFTIAIAHVLAEVPFLIRLL
jgi:hypothetical protein